MPGARALLLLTLAALLTVLAGPSAAAYAEPTDGHVASIAGIAPNGDHATARGQPVPVPVPPAVPGEHVTLIPPVRTDVVAPTEPSMIPGAPDCAQRGRAPPAG